MRKVIVIVAGLLIVAATVLVGTATSQATPTPQHTVKNHLSISGTSVAGVTSVISGQILVFDFIVKNHGTTAEPGDVSYTWSHAKYVDIICPLVSTGGYIASDTPACEPGNLAPGGSTQSAILLKLNVSSGPIVVTGCATEENNGVPPQCATVSIPVD